MTIVTVTEYLNAKDAAIELADDPRNDTPAIAAPAISSPVTTLLTRSCSPEDSFALLVMFWLQITEVKQ